jgi:short-subunit dehydrogenase
MQRPAAIITGASNGIGRGVAELLLVKGWWVLGLDREATTLQVANYEHLLVDLTQADFGAAFEELLTRLEPELVVHSAGIGIMQPFADSAIEVDERLIALNVGAAYAVTKAFVREAHRSQRPQHLILLSSLSGISATPGMALYAGSKHFVSGLAKSVAAELRQDAPWAKVSTVAPPPVRTQFRERCGRPTRSKPIRGVLEVREVAEEILRVYRRPTLDRIPGFWPRFLFRWVRPWIPQRILMSKIYQSAQKE